MCVFVLYWAETQFRPLKLIPRAPTSRDAYFSQYRDAELGIHFLPKFPPASQGLALLPTSHTRLKAASQFCPPPLTGSPETHFHPKPAMSPQDSLPKHPNDLYRGRSRTVKSSHPRECPYDSLLLGFRVLNSKPPNPALPYPPQPARLRFGSLASRMSRTSCAVGRFPGSSSKQRSTSCAMAGGASSFRNSPAQYSPP